MTRTDSVFPAATNPNAPTMPPRGADLRPYTQDEIAERARLQHLRTAFLTQTGAALAYALFGET